MGSFDGGDDGENNGIGFVEISKIFAMLHAICDMGSMAPFDNVLVL